MLSHILEVFLSAVLLADPAPEFSQLLLHPVEVGVDFLLLLRGQILGELGGPLDVLSIVDLLPRLFPGLLALLLNLDHPLFFDLVAHLERGIPDPVLLNLAPSKYAILVAPIVAAMLSLILVVGRQLALSIAEEAHRSAADSLIHVLVDLLVQTEFLQQLTQLNLLDLLPFSLRAVDQLVNQRDEVQILELVLPFIIIFVNLLPERLQKLVLSVMI